MNFKEHQENCPTCKQVSFLCPTTKSAWLGCAWGRRIRYHENIDRQYAAIAALAPMAIKLSPAQLTLLQEKQGGFTDTYKPGLKLIELGLIDVTGTGYYHWTISANGEEFLATNDKEKTDE